MTTPTDACAVEIIHEHERTPLGDGSYFCSCDVNIEWTPEHVWANLLAAHTNCETCAGSRLSPTWVSDEVGYECPDCTDGRGDRLLVAILMQPIGTYGSLAHPEIPEAQYDDNLRRGAYVERPVDQEPTDG